MFLSKHYHKVPRLFYCNSFEIKNCISCFGCRKIFTEPPVELDGEAHCKQCTNILGASSASSPAIRTPDNERVEAVESRSRSNSLNLMGSIPSDSYFQPRAGEKTANDNCKLSQITNRLQSLRVKPALRNSAEVPSPSTPTYSRTFNQLQATVNGKTAAPASIRTRPRKASESSGGLSFADLLNSRRGTDSRLGTLSRRPLSMMSSELSKRSSLPVASRDSPVEGSVGANNPVLAHNINRLARPRPNSINFGNGRFAPESAPDIPTSSAVKRANRVSSFIPQRSFNLSQDSQSSQVSSTKESPVSTPCPELESSSSDSTPPQGLSTSPDSELSTKNSSSDSCSTPASSSKLSCSKCELGISDTWFKLPDGRVLHKECFQCHQCRKVIEDGKYSVYDDHEYHTDVSPGNIILLISSAFCSSPPAPCPMSVSIRKISAIDATKSSTAPALR